MGIKLINLRGVEVEVNKELVKELVAKGFEKVVVKAEKTEVKVAKTPEKVEAPKVEKTETV